MKTGFLHNDHVVQALAADRANQAYHIGILPRRLRRGENFPNSEPLCRFVEFLSLDAIAVAQQIPRRGVPGESFQPLPGRPFRRGVRRHSKMDRTPTVVRENHKDEQKPGRDRRNNEEVGRDHVLHVVLQKCPPILRRRLPVPDHVLRDCCLRD